MPLPENIYTNCDILDALPKPNRDNWLYEIELLRNELSKGASVLQVGSMDGTRIIELLGARPDLKITGLEVEASLVALAAKNLACTSFGANFVCGDITNPPALPFFDYVICLNNTLGYITNQSDAINEMKRLGRVVMISVYGEKFDESLAKYYFTAIGLTIDRVENKQFVMKEFTSVKRYTKEVIAGWRGQVSETPIGYFCRITTPQENLRTL